MQFKLAALTFGLTLALCACAGKAERNTAQRALDLRQKLLSGTCSFQAELTADYGEYVSEFSVSCVHNAEDGTTMTIHAPQTLAGLRAQVDKTGAKLVFEDTEAAFGTLTNLKLSPMAAPQLLAQAWESGYISLIGTEDGALHVTYLLGYDEDELTIDTWLKDGAPEYAQIACGGQTVLQAVLTDFTIQEAKTDYENTQKNMGGYLVGQSGT